MSIIRKIRESIYLDTHTDDEPILYEEELVRVVSITYDESLPSCARAKVIRLRSDDSNPQRLESIDVFYICASKLKFEYELG